MNNELKKKAILLVNLINKLNKKKPVYLSIPDITSSDISTISNELKKNNVAIGNYTKKFIAKLKIITNSNNLLLTANGTVALYASLVSENIGKNDEILVPSLNYIASVNAILACKGTPHFIDSSLNDFGVDFEKLEIYLQNITKIQKNFTINKFTKKKIKALMLAHVFGHATNLSKAKKICKKYKLVLIEDAAEALGTKYKNKHVGTFGSYGVISFNGNKIITSGGGGALIVKNNNKYKKLKKIIDNGKIFDNFNFLHNHFGLNLNLSNLNASLGYSQLKKLKNKIKQRKLLFKIYSKLNNDKFEFVKKPANSESNFWLQAVRLKNKKEKNFLQNFLYKNKIQTRSIWKPNHLFNHLKKYPKMNLDNSLKLYNTIINVPSSINLKS